MTRARLLIGAVCLSGCAAAGSPRGGLRVDRVFGPEIPGRYKHPSSLTELPNGDLFLVYHGGKGEYSDDTAVFGSRKPREGGSWEPPRVVADTPDRGEGNAVIWQAPDRLVWLFYVTRYGPTWSTSRIKAKFASVDEGGVMTWSEPAATIASEPGMMVRNRPIVLGDGSYLLPIYHEVSEDTEWVGPESTGLFLKYDPAVKTWRQTGRIRSPRGSIQPAPVELAPGKIVSYCRRGGGYGPSTDGYLVRAESHDGGETWTTGRDSGFPNPNAAVDFIKLRSGNLLLAYNDSMSDRTPLTVALSTDGDRSYRYRRNIAEGSGSFSYPCVVQTSDGRIHCVFTSDERTVVRHAVFEEDWVLGGSWPEGPTNPP